ncbi:MAG: polysaccharide biosynthesis tyrosine autokinase, partial [Candidatus Electrothrix sp. MAN1_4]|nr:polysaccharide biosynthesis tyrosine autokinase [Candidatus Electrothrix sp. MAN1_4]
MTTNSTQPAVQEQEINLHQFILVLRRRYPYLIAIFLVSLLLAGVYSLRQTPLYQGTALLIFEPSNNNAPIDFAKYDQIKLNEFIETQKKIITSRKVVGRTLEALNIEKLSQKKTGGLVSALRDMIGNMQEFFGMKKGESTEPDPVALFTQKITAEPLRNTNLMQLQVADPDPEKAARYTNTLARIYIEYDLEDRRVASGNAFTWLSEQVAVLKAKVQNSEMDLLKYKQEESLTSIEKRQNTIDDKITELNENLSKMVMQRLEKEAILKEIRGLATKLHKTDGIPEVMENSQIKLLKEEYNKIEIEFARISTKFKKSHPERVRLSTQLSHIRKKITGEAGKVVKDLEIGIHILQKKEEALAHSLESYKKQARKIAEQAIEYGVLKREAESNKQMYNVLLERLKETDIGSSIVANNIRIVDKAEVPGSPFSPNIPRNLLLAGVLGLFVGTGTCFLIEYFDNTIKGRHDLELLLGLEFIGAVPEKKKTVSLGGKMDKIVSRAHQESISMLDFYRKDHLLKTLMVTSALPGEGKTSTIAGLGITYARAGKKVLMVDADIFKPRLNKELNLPNEPGVFDYFHKDADPAELIMQTPEENLFLLPSGLIPPNPAELISSKKMEHLLKSLADTFDLILVDAPPVTASSGIAILASYVDGVALVIRAHTTNYHTAATALKDL